MEGNPGDKNLEAELEQAFKKSVREYLSENPYSIRKPIQNFKIGETVWLHDGSPETGTPVKLLKYESGVYLGEVVVQGEKKILTCTEDNLTYLQ